MNKTKIIALSTLAFVALFGSFGIGILNKSNVVHAQTLPAQTQQATLPETADANEKPDAVETASTVAEQAGEKTLPGGGHQDANGSQVDHQYEGIE